MKAEELRIGNYAAKRLRSGNGRTLEAPLGVQDIVCIKENTGSFIYESIHLTEEWLVRAGFQRRDSSTCTQWFIGINDVTHDWLFDLTWLENPVLINAPDAPFYRNGKHTIFYVHQLQNLYFALTGEELEFASIA